jgi:hypothetical protein
MYAFVQLLQSPCGKNAHGVTSVCKRKIYSDNRMLLPKRTEKPVWGQGCQFCSQQPGDTGLQQQLGAHHASTCVCFMG